MIEQTEALVSIDVNGGHCMLGDGTSQEKAILDVNLTAAKQVSRCTFCHHLSVYCLIISLRDKSYKFLFVPIFVSSCG